MTEKNKNPFLELGNDKPEAEKKKKRAGKKKKKASNPFLRLGDDKPFDEAQGEPEFVGDGIFRRPITEDDKPLYGPGSDWDAGGDLEPETTFTPYETTDKSDFIPERQTTDEDPHPENDVRHIHYRDQAKGDYKYLIDPESGQPENDPIIQEMATGNPRRSLKKANEMFQGLNPGPANNYQDLKPRSIMEYQNLYVDLIAKQDPVSRTQAGMLKALKAATWEMADREGITGENNRWALMAHMIEQGEAESLIRYAASPDSKSYSEEVLFEPGSLYERLFGWENNQDNLESGARELEGIIGLPHGALNAVHAPVTANGFIDQVSGTFITPSGLVYDINSAEECRAYGVDRINEGLVRDAKTIVYDMPVDALHAITKTFYEDMKASHESRDTIFHRTNRATGVDGSVVGDLFLGLADFVVENTEEAVKKNPDVARGFMDAIYGEDVTAENEAGTRPAEGWEKYGPLPAFAQSLGAGMAEFMLTMATNPVKAAIDNPGFFALMGMGVFKSTKTKARSWWKSRKEKIAMTKTVEAVKAFDKYVDTGKIDTKKEAKYVSDIMKEMDPELKNVVEASMEAARELKKQSPEDFIQMAKEASQYYDGWNKVAKRLEKESAEKVKAEMEKAISPKTESPHAGHGSLSADARQMPEGRKTEISPKPEGRKAEISPKTEKQKAKPKPIENPPEGIVPQGAAGDLIKKENLSKVADNLADYAREKGFDVKVKKAQTGTEYLEIDGTYKIRVADHADAYGTAHYSLDPAYGNYKGATKFIDKLKTGWEPPRIEAPKLDKAQKDYVSKKGATKRKNAYSTVYGLEASDIVRLADVIREQKSEKGVSWREKASEITGKSAEYWKDKGNKKRALDVIKEWEKTQTPEKISEYREQARKKAAKGKAGAKKELGAFDGILKDKERQRQADSIEQGAKEHAVRLKESFRDKPEKLKNKAEELIREIDESGIPPREYLQYADHVGEAMNLASMEKALYELEKDGKISWEKNGASKAAKENFFNALKIGKFEDTVRIKPALGNKTVSSHRLNEVEFTAEGYKAGKLELSADKIKSIAWSKNKTIVRLGENRRLEFLHRKGEYSSPLKSRPATRDSKFVANKKTREFADVLVNKDEVKAVRRIAEEVTSREKIPEADVRQAIAELIEERAEAESYGLVDDFYAARPAKLEKTFEPIFQRWKKENAPRGGSSGASASPLEAGGPDPGARVYINDVALMKHLEDTYGASIGRGHFRQKAGGIYKAHSEKVRMHPNQDKSVSTGVHEVIGHHLDKMFDITGHMKKGSRGKLPKDVRAELTKLDYGYPKKRRSWEGMAEYMRHWITLEDAAQLAPKFHKWFWDHLRKHDPAMIKKLEKTRSFVRKYIDDLTIEQKMDRAWSYTGREKRAEGQSAGQWVKERAVDGIHRAYAAMKDEFHEGNLFQKEWVKKGGKGEGPYDLMMAFSQSGPTLAHTAVQEGVFKVTGKMERIGPSLVDVFKEISHKESNNFSQWASARHAIETWKKGKNPGIALDVAREFYEKYKNPRFERTAQRLTEYHNSLIDMLLDADVLTPEGAELIKGAYETYLPLRRVVPKELFGKPIGKKIFDQGSPVKGRKGSGAVVFDPLQSTLEMTVEYYQAALKQQAARKFIEAAEGVEGLGGWIDRIPPKMEGRKLSVDALEEMLERARVPEDAMIEIISDLKGKEFNNPKVLGDIMTIWEPNYWFKSKEPIVRVVIGGEPRLYEMKKSLYKTLNGLDYYQLPKWADIIFGKACRAMKMGATTLSMDFAGRNVLRDYVTFLAQRKYSKGLKGAVPAVDMVGAYLYSRVMEIAGKKGDPVVELFREMGGELSTVFGLDRKKMRSTLKDVMNDSAKRRAYKIARDPVEAFRTIIDAAEVGPRLKEFYAALESRGWTREKIRQALERGERPPRDVIVEALNAASDVTVNFKRQGWIGKRINRVFPFWNAKLEGADKFVRTWKDQPKRAMINSAGIAASTIVYWQMVHDQDWYKEAPAWLKYGFYTIADEEGRPIVRLPKAHEWGLNIAGGTEALLNMINERDPEALGEWGGQVAESLMPGYQPALLTPAIETYFNYDLFRNRPVVDYFTSRKQARHQYYHYNTELMKAVGGELNISPAKLDHLASGLTGGLSYDILNAAESVVSGFKGHTLHDVPGVGGFMLRKEYSKSIDEFYERREELAAKRQAAKETGEKISWQENAEYKKLNKIARIMADINDQIKDAENPYAADPYYRVLIGLARKGLGKPELDRYQIKRLPNLGK